MLTAVPAARVAGALAGVAAGSAEDVALVARLEAIRCHLTPHHTCIVVYVLYHVRSLSCVLYHGHSIVWFLSHVLHHMRFIKCAPSYALYHMRFIIYENSTLFDANCILF